MTDELSWADLGLGDADLSDVEAAEGFEDRVGEGVFNCKVVDMVIEKDRNDRPRVYFEYEIQDGEKEGLTVREYQHNVLEEQSKRYLKRRFISLGMPNDFKGMPTKDHFIGFPCVVTRKKNKEYLNVTNVVGYSTGAEVNHPGNTPPVNNVTPSPVAASKTAQFSNLFE